MHLAAAGGHTRCILALLGAGATLHCRTRYGTMPHHLAAEAGHADALRELLRAGADVNADSMPSCEWTPLFYAAAYGHLEAAHVLLQHGARYHLISPAKGGAHLKPLSGRLWSCVVSIDQPSRPDGQSSRRLHTSLLQICSCHAHGA